MMTIFVALEREQQMYITLVPAYGRDYLTAKAVKKDWNDNLDFQIQCMFHKDNGRYINKPQADLATEKFQIRYDKLTKIWIPK